MSTTLSAMTAAELVAELRFTQETIVRFRQVFANHGLIPAETDKLHAIAAELDARCEMAGIMIDPEGYPVFFNFDHCKHFSAPKPELYASAEFLPPPQPVARVNVKAEDVRDLLSYLLTKGGAK